MTSRRSWMLGLALGAFISVNNSSDVLAQAPRNISYQGQLMENGAPANGSAWLTGGDMNYRVLRGGSWNDANVLLRSSSRRRRRPPDGRSATYGFRVVAISAICPGGITPG